MKSERVRQNGKGEREARGRKWIRTIREGNEWKKGKEVKEERQEKGNKMIYDERE